MIDPNKTLFVCWTRVDPKEARVGHLTLTGIGKPRNADEFGLLAALVDKETGGSNTTILNFIEL